MMIKFRVWNTRSEKMRPVDTLYFQNGEIAFVGVLTDEVSDWDGKPKGYSKFSIHNEYNVLMQSTGCRDKNGIEIYEGDVIKDKYDKTWLVQWFVGAFVITDKILDSDGQKFTYSHFNNVSNHHFYFEVIGNIYENPELLEVVE